VGARLLAPAPGPWKAADVERFPDDGYRYEIWHGELVRVVPPGGRHGECEANLVAGLRQQTRALGRVYTGDTGFLLREDPDELVSPDVAFVRQDRLPPPAQRIGYLRVVPDLVVEIRSPNDAEADVRARLTYVLKSECRSSGSWTRRNTWWRKFEPWRVVNDSRLMRADAGDMLEGGALVPGFWLSLGDIFE
jgi:Uma2 family endonuclease